MAWKAFLSNIRRSQAAVHDGLTHPNSRPGKKSFRIQHPRFEPIEVAWDILARFCWDASPVISPDISPQSAQRPQRATIFQKTRETRLFRTFQLHSRMLTCEGRKYRGCLCVLCVLCGSNAMSGISLWEAVGSALRGPGARARSNSRKSLLDNWRFRPESPGTLGCSTPGARGHELGTSIGAEPESSEAREGDYWARLSGGLGSGRTGYPEPDRVLWASSRFRS
jgi:hypothetical protein